MSESSSKTTTDLETIKSWAEEREGKPSRVKSTADGEGGGVLRIDFPGYSGGDSLEEISWEEWFETFTDRNLAFLYQDHTAGGKESRFFKLITNKGDREQDGDQKKDEQKAKKDDHKNDKKDEPKAKKEAHKEDKKDEPKAKKDDHKNDKKDEPKAKKEDHKDDKKKEAPKAKEETKAKKEDSKKEPEKKEAKPKAAAKKK